MQSRNLTGIARTLRKKETWAERLMWGWLRDRRFSAYKFRRQHPIGQHILDFFCSEARLDIELDGSRHGFPEHQQLDAERDGWRISLSLWERAGVRGICPFSKDFRKLKCPPTVHADRND